ncbi:hypothetical protein NJ959_02960 [Symplocastrum sp. BBK-W-15]|uniref:Uncharacterized protein n=1 Tax=Limnofasciculus baicalensis BBK-W-15 TaxID=2699891 RepID=A0AAE3GRX3_9CYAN|nr:hypothetical protein [Limnofasciculus baicalensis BBK-W-15]
MDIGLVRCQVYYLKTLELKRSDFLSQGACVTGSISHKASARRSRV